MSGVTTVGRCVGVLAVLHLTAPPAALAQTAEPASTAAFAGRVSFGGDASVTVGSADPGWFTYTDYETSAIRRVRAGIAVEARITPSVTALFEARGETGRGVTPYAWYVRYRPWKSGILTVQAGRVPPVFGAYARRSYPRDNPLVADPLLYQYLTSLRPDAVPATADDLLRMRARGWLVWYPVGSEEWHNGVPPVASSQWDTGAQAMVVAGSFQAAGAVTSGSLSYPRAGDVNQAPHVSGRVAWHPAVGVVIGASASRSVFLDEGLVSALPEPAKVRPYRQQALGVDGEFSRGYWLLRGEFVSNAWTLPDIGSPHLGGPLRARGGYLEYRYRLHPRLYVAGRADRLAFSGLQGSVDARTWDANVTRVEAGGGFVLRRRLLLKGSYLFHQRDGGRVRVAHMWAAQLMWWF